MQTKKLFLVLLTGALLLAGLYFFRGKKNSNRVAILKPSQLDFSKSNQLQEPMPMQEQAAGNAPEEDKDDVDIPEGLSAEELQRWSDFLTILDSKNDSDPRVNELKNLSPKFRKLLIDKYSSLNIEDRSGRGFIVFLIAKDLKSVSDVEFLQKVYQESPCLSLESCAASSRDENSHTSGIDQTTLIYPQLVALFQIDKQLTEKPELLKDPAMRAGILASLKQAEAFPVPAVHDRAEQIRKKYNL